MRYAVRCCCQPKKVFGWLDLPEGLRDGQRLPLWRPLPAVDVSSSLIDVPPAETILIRTIRLPDGMRDDGRLKWREELAVYSEDRPEAFWRALPNFTPAADDPASYSTLHDDRDG